MDKEKLKKELSPELYHIAVEKGTEKPFSGKYYKHSETGSYHCTVCGNELFSSETKFDTDCGWPSFYAPKDSSKIKTTIDSSFGMERTEVTCAKCGAHLGHLFEDSPQVPTGQRFCINSVSLDFKKSEK